MAISDNFLVELDLKVRNTNTGNELLDLTAKWPTNDYLSMIKLQQAIISGVLEKTTELGEELLKNIGV